MFKRNLPLPPPGEDTFFLWGPRQTGKTTLLRQRYPDARWVDLLKADEFRRYMANPERLREEIETAGTPPGGQVVIDEVQKAPALLDEVHWLIENRGVHFALCGSSARKVRRGAANLLGGRALRFELRGLTAAEVGDGFDLTRVPLTFHHAEQAGSLPMHHRDPFDRCLIAQAQAEGLVLVTRDARIPLYGVRTMAA